MGNTRIRRPPAPTAAERARSLATRSDSVAFVGTSTPEPVAVAVHHVAADGSATLLLDDNAPLLEQIRRAARGELPVMLEVTDRAPVELRQPVRGLLWISGWLRIPDPETARRTAVCIAEVHPHPRLLDLGHGATLVRLDPNSAVLSDAEGSAALAPVELAAAQPDPFCQLERRWLRHLEEAHPEAFVALARHLPPALRSIQGAQVRPLGMDRCGLRLRVETPTDDHDVRIAWPQAATTVEQLRRQFGLLVGCPFRGLGLPDTQPGLNP
ncbi:DUF2470 domain-containing protein [Pseudonocardia asaccharolytica]|uniref:DUF2470 domain-containing protein n=1 Tax=Pseudonocardia asaccharolytica DSM 44247 = NBRC 16224 TaxID=1123024 RepID=A0A511CV58_9PSEU|nr:DUF2470 domain-containing protein [Pseudonocardia asaccharolytica]GEL16459.1 hypothetical protein PA7_02960 [Pseudonocardia asaccharolytica DSM 44247 = NBRC 16224]